MDTLKPKNSQSSSSGCSTASSSTDIKTTSKSKSSGATATSATAATAQATNGSSNGGRGGGDKMSGSRSRSFLFCLSKHLGRHFLHQHRRGQRENIISSYNSQEDVRSSSTDSFSLSLEHVPLQKTAGGGGGSNGGGGAVSTNTAYHLASSSFDLTGTSDEHSSSRTSSLSPCSRFAPHAAGLSASSCQMDTSNHAGPAAANYRHIYVDTLYRPGCVMDRNGELSTDDDGEDDDDEDEDEDREDRENANDGDDEDNLESYRSKSGLVVPRIHHPSANTASTTPRSMSSASASATGVPSSTSKAGGLHLSRISISSSVSRMLHHFSSVSAAASSRSLSCSSTPLRCFKDMHSGHAHSHGGRNNGGGAKGGRKQQQQQQSLSTTSTAAGSKKSISSSKSAPITTPPSASSSSMSSSSVSGGRSGSGAAKKSSKDKKQQSILRPPIHYVYMKGMSGLYSRVPRYTVCCPYSMQQFA